MSVYVCVGGTAGGDAYGPYDAFVFDPSVATGTGGGAAGYSFNGRDEG